VKRVCHILHYSAAVKICSDCDEQGKLLAQRVFESENFKDMYLMPT
jgi:hypothetical protein